MPQKKAIRVFYDIISVDFRFWSIIISLEELLFLFWSDIPAEKKLAALLIHRAHSLISITHQTNRGIQLKRLAIDAPRTNAVNIEHINRNFYDVYGRDGMHAKGKSKSDSLVYSCCIPADEETTWVPIDPLMQSFMQSYTENHQLEEITFRKPASNPTRLSAYTGIFLKVSNDELFTVVHDLGIMGGLLARNEQLKLYLYLKGSEAIEKKLVSDSLKTWGFKPRSIFQSQPFSQSKPAEITSEQRFSNILKTIKTKTLLPESLFSEQQLFYKNLIYKILVNYQALYLEESLIPKAYMPQFIQTLHRIELAIQYLIQPSISYRDFLTYIEHCVDECLILLALPCSKKTKAPNKTKAEEVSNNLKAFVESYALEVPVFATLRHSGMQAINNAIFIAKEQMNQFNQFNYKGNTSIALDPVIYFEINLSQALINEPVSSNCDILVLCFDNDGIERPFEQYTDPTLTLKKAFPSLLEKNLQQETQRKIVIIDYTLNNFDGFPLAQLKHNFADVIKAGQLCLLVVNSLNKHFGLGLDKTPAGLLYGFYNQDFFPLIGQTIKSELEQNKLGSMEAADPTVLLVNHLTLCAREEIERFPLLIKARTEKIFQNHVSDSLKDPEKIITFVKRDLFISMFINVGILGVIDADVYDIVGQVIRALSIQEREGFAFNHTSYSRILEEKMLVFRFSIGTELLSEVESAFSVLNLFCIEALSLFEKNEESDFLIKLNSLKDSLIKKLPDRRDIKESIKLVRNNGKLLSLMTDELKDSYTVVYNAVLNDGMALKDASKDMRADRRIVNVAVRQNPNASKYACVPEQKLRLELTAKFSIWSLVDEAVDFCQKQEPVFLV